MVFHNECPDPQKVSVAPSPCWYWGICVHEGHGKTIWNMAVSFIKLVLKAVAPSGDTQSRVKMKRSCFAFKMIGTQAPEAQEVVFRRGERCRYGGVGESC